jgi:hypothetical protein
LEGEIHGSRVETSLEKKEGLGDLEGEDGFALPLPLAEGREGEEPLSFLGDEVAPLLIGWVRVGVVEASSVLSTSGEVRASFEGPRGWESGGKEDEVTGLDEDGAASEAGRELAMSEVLATVAGWEGDKAGSGSERGLWGGAGGGEGDFWGEAGGWQSGGVGAGMVGRDDRRSAGRRRRR